MSGDIDPIGRYRVTLHLTGCHQCRAVVDGKPSSPAPASEAAGTTQQDRPSPYEAFFRETYASLDEKSREIEEQRLAAPELLRELERHPQVRWSLLVVNSSRFQTYGLAEHLLAECRSRWNDDPEGSEDLAALALTTMDQLQVEPDEEPLVHDLRAEAWAYVANCRRLRSRIDRVDLVEGRAEIKAEVKTEIRAEIEAAFAQADHYLAMGTGDAIESAAILDLKASFLLDRSARFEALSILQKAARIYHRFGDRHLEGQILLRTAKVAAEIGEISEAGRLLQEGSRLIDPEREFLANGMLRSQTAPGSLMREVMAQIEVHSK